MQKSDWILLPLPPSTHLRKEAKRYKYSHQIWLTLSGVRIHNSIYLTQIAATINYSALANTLCTSQGLLTLLCPSSISSASVLCSQLTSFYTTYRRLETQSKELTNGFVSCSLPSA
jgi:hypothetical protein